MTKTYLIIVESPAKCKKIASYLHNYKNNKYIVKASVGHIRELAKKNMGIDFADNFKPIYQVSSNKRKVVADLKKYLKTADEVIIASDEDREGEAIGWHICQVLKLDVTKTKRITFNEITKKSICTAIDNPHTLNMNLVHAQQCRVVLDKLVGYMLSPVLWKNIKYKGKLSAGRVQSIILKLIIDKDNEIKKHTSENYYQTLGTFNKKISGELNKNLNKKIINEFLNNCIRADFICKNITETERISKPPPPFHTSSLQQAGISSLKTSSSNIMRMAQKLYEKGLITYHRTDSTDLSQYILDQIKDYVKETYSAKYYKARHYKKKIHNSQEAHEAIRPTTINVLKPDDLDDLTLKLYELIWKRTVASQMSAAIYFVQMFDISISNRTEIFKVKKELLKFNGFLKLYNKENEDIKKKYKIKENELLKYKKINCDQKFKNPPPRYSEGTIIRKLGKLGIGRPSTYSYVIGVIVTRKYAKIGNTVGEKVDVINHTLRNDIITQTKSKFKYSTENKKFIPTAIGKEVCDFLVKHFNTIMDINFTAEMENKLNLITTGDNNYVQVIDNYYKNIKNRMDKIALG